MPIGCGGRGAGCLGAGFGAGCRGFGFAWARRKMGAIFFRGELALECPDGKRDFGRGGGSEKKSG